MYILLPPRDCLKDKKTMNSLKTGREPKSGKFASVANMQVRVTVANQTQALATAGVCSDVLADESMYLAVANQPLIYMNSIWYRFYNQSILSNSKSGNPRLRALQEPMTNLISEQPVIGGEISDELYCENEERWQSL